jgi:hypothetical protein
MQEIVCNCQLKNQFKSLQPINACNQIVADRQNTSRQNPRTCCIANELFSAAILGLTIPTNFSKSSVQTLMGCQRRESRIRVNADS